MKRIHHICHIVNPNGLGHLRRAITIWNNVNVSRIKVSLLLDNSHKDLFHFFEPADWLVFHFYDFRGQITLGNIKNTEFVSDYFALQESILHIVDSYSPDLVISDNSLFDLSQMRTKYLVFGSFFWLDILSSSERFNRVVENEKKILELTQPLICYTKGFDSGTLCQYTNKLGFGWLVSRTTQPKSKNVVFGVLCSGGMGDLSLDFFAEIVNKIRIYFGTIKLYVSYKFLQLEDSERFDFLHDWEHIDLVVGRPGLGTISDCIEFSKPLLAVGEEYNVEISQNARNIQEKGIGWDFVNNEFEVGLIKDLRNFRFPVLDKEGVKDVEKMINKLLENAG